MEINLEKVQALCERVIGKKYSSIKRMGGLTNYTYHVAVEDGKEYVVRLPGEGTEALINRSEEKISTKQSNFYFFSEGLCLTKINKLWTHRKSNIFVFKLS